MGKWLPMATVAIEDSGFWSEPGIDVFAMGRAAWIDWRTKQPVQGASTITQQLVKLRLTGNQPTIDRKIKEAVLALQVEHTYTKRQILEQYLNAVDYSNSAKGSQAAARVYFHKDTKDLDLAQASMLAGIPQSPLYNDPIRHWDQARTRQLDVLKAMVRTHRITQEEADEAFAAKTKFGRLVVQGGLTTGLLHALVAMDLPGPGTVFLSQNWKFTAPVFIGDTITAEAEVTSVHATKPVTGLRVQIKRQDGEVVLDGEAWCYTFTPST